MNPAKTSSSSGLPGLYVELYWGSELTEARTFGADVTEVIGGPSESSPLRMYGFSLAGETHHLATRTERGYRIYPPAQVSIERIVKGDAPVRLTHDSLPREGERPYLELQERGVTVTLAEGHLKMVVQSSVPVRRIQKLTVKEVMTIGFIAVTFLAAPVGFLVMGTSSHDHEEFNERALKAARHEASLRQDELDRLYPSLPAGTVDAGENVRRVPLPAAVSVH